MMYIKFNIMKKLFVLMLAAMTFVACDDDPNDAYFEQLSLEELLTTGAGVDFLVRTSESVDSDAIVGFIKDNVFYVDRNEVFVYDEGWGNPLLNGAGSSYTLIWDDYTIYKCWWNFAESCESYRKIEHEGDHYAALMREFGKDAQVVAFVENVLIIQYHDDYGRFIRQIAYIRDSRDEIIDKFLKDVVM